MLSNRLLLLKKNILNRQNYINKITRLSFCDISTKNNAINNYVSDNCKKTLLNLKSVDQISNNFAKNFGSEQNKSVQLQTKNFKERFEKWHKSGLKLINKTETLCLQNRRYSTTVDGSHLNQNKFLPSVSLDLLKDPEFEVVNKLFPTPKNVLHNAFDTVVKELNNNELKVTPHYNKIKERNKTHSWCCTYYLKWPETIKIVAVAKTKQEASHKAALSALVWLKKNGKISKEGYPILVNKQDANELTQENLDKLVLDEVTCSKIQEIIDEHQNEFVKYLVSNVDQENLPNESEDLEKYSQLSELRFSKKSNPQFLGTEQYLAKEKVKLPIADYKNEFMRLLNENKIVIVKGEPGCGKSTRIPQYVLESWAREADNNETNCRIAVTQPRRIAAISLAQRVANERDENTGHVVGYQVRLNSNFLHRTGRVLYCTTGILLRHLQSDPKLSHFSHVILDEAHERDVNTDLLMNLLKRTLESNSNLKLIVMSATIDTDMFQKYFENAPVMHIPGFTYPVKEHFMDDINLDLSKTSKMCSTDFPTVIHEDVVKLIQHIHKTKDEGGILCFLPGWEDISNISKLLPKSNDISLVCLHSRLQDSDQNKIFSKPPPGIRKIILATNIAETSVTIDDIVYVIDTGICKDKRFDSDKGVMCMDNHWISQSSMIQRKGRAGRCQPGESFHLYPKSKYLKFDKFSVPEILRTSLTKIILDSKVYNSNIDAVEFMRQLPSPPNDASIMKAVDELKDLELLDDLENLTPLGRTLAEFQLEPKLSKALVNSVIFKCVTPVVDIVTLFSSETELFISGLIDKGGIKRIKSQFNKNSDHLALMRIFEKWLEYYEEGDSYTLDRFCKDTNLISHKLATMQKLRTIHFEYLYNSLKKSLPISDNYSDNNELIKAVLLSGVGTVLQHRNWDIVKGRLKTSNTFLTKNNHKASVTSDSVNFKKVQFPSKFLLYINETRSNIRRMTVVRECSVISTLSVLLFSNKNLKTEEIKSEETNDQVKLGLEGTKIEVLCPRKQAEDIIKCKTALSEAYQYFVFQLTQGGEYDQKVNKSWDRILKNVNEILLKHSV